MENARVSLLGKGQQAKLGCPFPWPLETRVRGSMSRAATALFSKPMIPGENSLFSVSILTGQAQKKISLALVVG